jgi:hypothetical protein
MKCPALCQPRAFLLPGKLGHHENQNRPLGLKTGQYHRFKKEHIANKEQMEYIPLIGTCPIPVRRFRGSPTQVLCPAGESRS